MAPDLAAPGIAIENTTSIGSRPLNRSVKYEVYSVVLSAADNAESNFPLDFR